MIDFDFVIIDINLSSSNLLETPQLIKVIYMYPITWISSPPSPKKNTLKWTSNSPYLLETGEWWVVCKLGISNGLKRLPVEAYRKILNIKAWEN